MRKLLWIVVALTALYGGYWWVAAMSLRQSLDTALTGMKESGQADYTNVALRGFPSRFDVTIDKPVLRDAEGTLAWSAPFLQAFALSYRPNRVILVWPPSQRIEVGRQAIDVTSGDMRASLAVGIGTSLPLDHMEAVARELAATDGTGWTALADEVRFATRRAPAEANGHEIGLDLFGLRLAGLPLPADLAAQPLMGRLRAVAAMSGPVALAGQEAPPVVTALDIRDGAIEWGALRLSARGRLAVTETGAPDGTLDLEVTEWRAAVRLMVETGVLDASTASTMERLLSRLAAQDGQTLRLPLVFRSGLVALGPVPLGPAPRFPGYLQ